MVTLNELETAIQQSWCADSCYDSNWNPEIPAGGQCVATVQVVYKYFGGNILRTRAITPDNQVVEHYYNLIDGKVVDFTKSQLPEGTVIPEGRSRISLSRSIKGIMSILPKAQDKYAVLKERVEMALNGGL